MNVWQRSSLPAQNGIPCASQCTIHADRHYGSDTSPPHSEASRDAIFNTDASSRQDSAGIFSRARNAPHRNTLAPRLIAEIGDVSDATASGSSSHTPHDAPPHVVRQILRRTTGIYLQAGNRYLAVEDRHEVMQSYVMYNRQTTRFFTFIGEKTQRERVVNSAMVAGLGMFLRESIMARPQSSTAVCRQ